METDYESMTPESAVSEIETIRADEKHLFNSAPGTAGRQEAIEHISNLYKVKHGELNPDPPDSATAKTTDAFLQAKSAESFKPEHIKAMGEALDLAETRSAEEQEKLCAQANDDMDKLYDLGYERIEISDDIPAWKVENLKLFRIDAEGDYATLAPLIAGQLQSCQTLPATQKMFSDFANASDPMVDDKYREEIMTATTKWIQRMNTKSHKLNEGT